ncbi:anaphase promoting complex subunit 5 [Tieghemostelium lacteum]|uniref:Anaphase-promoting complex subunit 5 n=1 Tax=Tieghemostelium lacteum TaxID=361077 RepID=A0A152A3L3_TIELA|nr:anaphase promoting complex subunit 5 [Tieghemostelium lacteum]|eukprot:KYR00853.1 anaphase promoting complex subunit 5 [Tieghemostelium lacteum]
MNNQLFLENEFIKQISFESVDELHHFMTSLDDLFVIGQDSGIVQQQQNGTHQLDSRSILGLFVKKVLLNFKSTLFDGLIKLFDQMSEYLNQYYRDCDQYTMDCSDGDSTPRIEFRNTFLSPQDEERYIYEEILKINGMTGRVSPLEIQVEIDQLKNLLPQVSKIHLLSLLYHCSHYDYEQSIEEVHRYFDYCNSNGSMILESVGSLNSANMMLPYAVLNLVKVHFHFGHYEEAYLALRETIRIAQERSDHTCLALSEHWLMKFLDLSVYKTLENTDLLEYLLLSHRHEDLLRKNLVRSQQLEMDALSSLNHSTLSKYHFQHTKSEKSQMWSDIFQPIQQSNLKDESILNNNHLLQSNIWELLGNYSLSQYFIELTLKYNTPINNNNDNSVLKGSSSTAFSQNKKVNSSLPLYASSNILSTNSLSLNNFIRDDHQYQQPHKQQRTETALQSYCRLASIYATQGDYKGSLQVLVNAINENQYHQTVSTDLSFAMLLLIYQTLLNQNVSLNDTSSTMELVIEQMIALGAKCQPLDTQWYQILCSRHCISQYYLQRKMYEKAYKYLCDCINLCKDYGMERECIPYHLLLSNLYTKTTGTRYHLYMSLPYTLNALSLSSDYQSHLSIAQSNLLLGQCHFQQCQYEKTLDLIHQTLSFILSNKHSLLQIQLYMLWSKCIMIHKNSLTQSLDKLSISEDLSMKISSCEYLLEIYYLKSLIYNNLNQIDNRNVYASKFKSLLLRQTSSLTINDTVKSLQENNNTFLLSLRV